VTAAERRRKALKKMESLRKRGHCVSPVVIEGRTIAKTFWGKAWCDHLEQYSDFANRLPRGRNYVRNGSVIDLQIAAGEIEASPIVFQTHALEAAEKGAPVEWLALDLVPVHAGAALLAAHAPHPHGALLMVDFLLGAEGQSVLGKFKYGSAAKDYGFKKWYFTAGLSADQLERQATQWEKLVQSIVKKGG